MSANDMITAFKGRSAYDPDAEMSFPFLVTSVNETDGSKSGFYIDDSGAWHPDVVRDDNAEKPETVSTEKTTEPAATPADTPAETVKVPTLSDADRAELARLRAARDEKAKADAADAAELAQLRAQESDATPSDDRTDAQREKDAADAAELESLRDADTDSRPLPGPGTNPGTEGVASSTPNPGGN